MSLALPVLYESLNSFPGVLAERVFAPWADMELALGHTAGRYSLESRHSLASLTGSPSRWAMN